MKNIHLLPTDKPSRLFLKENTLLLNNQYTLQKIFTKGKCQNIYITSDLEVKEGDLKVGEYYLYFNKIRQFKEIDNLNRAWKDYKKIILTTDQDLIANGVQAIDDEFLEWFVKNPSCEWVEVIYDKDAFPYGVETAKGYGWYKLPIPQEEPKIDSIFNEANVRFSETLDKLSDNSLKQETTFEEDEIIDISDHDGIGNAVDNLNNEPPQETLEEPAENYAETYFNKDETSMRTSILSFKDGAKWQAERMYSEAIEFAEWIRIKDFQTTSKNNWIGLDMEYYTTQELFEQFKKK
jgi:hypothetical protein